MPTEREREMALERASNHHNHARRHAELQLVARQNAEFYSKGESGLGAAEDALRMKSCRERAAKFGRLEAAALKLINEALLEAGHQPSDVAEVDRHLYGVARSGLLAVYLGAPLPTDEDLAHSFEPLPGTRDDAAEERDEFASAIRAFWSF
jgi:hypothetical protein